MNLNRYTHKLNETTILPSSVVHKNHKITHIAKGDSGASQHYIANADKHLLTNITESDAQDVLLPNNQNITSTTTGILPLNPQLSPKACTANILPQLHTSLISLGQLADDNCTIILNKKFLFVLKNFKCILSGHRNITDGLWDIPLHNPSYINTQKLNVIIPKQQNISKMLQYFHACLFSPTKMTLLKAIKNGNFASLPGFSYANVAKFLQDTPATALGHLDQVCQGLQSTKQTLQEDPEDTSPTPNPSVTN